MPRALTIPRKIFEPPASHLRFRHTPRLGTREDSQIPIFVVPVLFSCDLRPMDDDLSPVPRHELAFDIERALSNAHGLWPRGRLGTDALAPIAPAVAEHLERCRIRCFRKPLLPGHSMPRR